MKNEIESNYILKSKIHFRFLISSVNKFTVTVVLQKVREINNRFAHKYGSTNIFIKSQDVWDWKRPLKTVWFKLLGQAGPHSWLSRTVFQQLLNFSKSGNYTLVLGILCQYAILLTVKKCFHVFKGNLLCLSLFPLPYFCIREITFGGIWCVSDRSCQKKQTDLN